MARLRGKNKPKRYIWHHSRDLMMDFMCSLFRLKFNHARPSMENPSEWGREYHRRVWPLSRRYPRPTL